MIWPPQSPDLNPIEQVWDFVKSRLEESDRVTNRTIWSELQKAWQLVTPELVQRYIGTMKDRFRAVILAKGCHTSVVVQTRDHQCIVTIKAEYKTSIKQIEREKGE